MAEVVEEVEEVAEVVEEVEEAVEEEEVVEADSLHHNKLSSPAKTKESWDNSPKYSMEIASKPKPSWKKSKDTSALTPMSMDLL